MNDFPKIGINTAELIAEVERLLELARVEKPELSAVNWGDLGIADIEYRISLLNAHATPCCTVIIEEAAPDSELTHWLYDHLDETKFPNVEFECAW